jgi:hypothetical protein
VGEKGKMRAGMGESALTCCRLFLFSNIETTVNDDGQAGPILGKNLWAFGWTSL